MITICGISGISLAPGDGDIDANLLCKELLLGIEIRGRDATGAAWYDEEGVLYIQKDAMKASDFVRHLSVPEYATNVILHTRFGTKGSEKDNNNNHPICTNGIVGVHNGCLYNDDQLFKIMEIEDKRIGEVDTEAAFAAIAYGKNLMPDGNPRLASTIEGILENIDGTAALAWQEVGGDPGVLYLARIFSSPLVVGKSKNGSLVFASTKEAIQRGAKAAGLVIETFTYPKEGTYAKIRNGEVVESSEFTPLTQPTYRQWQNNAAWDGDDYSSHYSKYSQGGTTTYVSKMGSTSVAKIDNKDIIDVVDDKKDASESPYSTYQFEPFIRPGALMLHISHALRTPPLEVLDTEQHLEWYEHREAAIDRFIKAQPVTATGPDPMETAAKFGCFLQQGDLVYTDVEPHETVSGQIWLMPASFPQGSFIIRALIPNKRYKGGYEAVLVERNFDEFIAVAKNTKSIELPAAPESESPPVVPQGTNDNWWTSYLARGAAGAATLFGGTPPL